MKTQKERNLEILAAAGWSIDPNGRTSKYTVLSKPGVPYRYYLGKAGAVRRGKNIASSVSVKLKANELVKRAQPLTAKEVQTMFDAKDRAAEKAPRIVPNGDNDIPVSEAMEDYGEAGESETLINAAKDAAQNSMVY